MARKTHKEIAEDAVKDLLVKMLHVYNQSIDKMITGDGVPDKPAEVKSLIDSGCRLIGFLEPRTHTQSLDKDNSADPADLKRAFGKLLAQQARDQANTAE